MTKNPPAASRTDASSTTSSRSLSLFFAVMMLIFSAYFIYWGIGYTNNNHTFLFLLATAFGLFMAFNIGGNDVANSFGTSVGAGTLTITQALAIAAIFEVSGAVIAGGEVTKTIRGGIVDLSTMAVPPMQFVYVMMGALLAAGLWLLFASKRGYPVSTTHSIIGGIVGSSIALGFVLSGSDSALALVKWEKIGTIAISWVLSPALGGIASFLLYAAIKKFILSYNQQADVCLNEIEQQKKHYQEQHKKAIEALSDSQKTAYASDLVRDASALFGGDVKQHEFTSEYFRELQRIEQQTDDVEAYKAIEQWVPLFAALGAMIISSMLLFKGLKNLALGFSSLHNYLIIGMIGATVWMATSIFARTLRNGSLERSTWLLFSWMQVFTASGFAFSHGSNDIANAIGPFAAILDVLRTGEIGSLAAVPTIAMATFGVALIVGLWFIGKEVIQTVGHNLTQMHPASGFSAELAASAVVMLASILGLPVSSTHILIGAVLGIGLVNRQTNWDLMKPIALAWVITLPAAAVLSAIFFLILNSIF